MSKPIFLVCPKLKVYNDFGFDNGNKNKYSESKINNCECLEYNYGIPCKTKGRCIIAKEDNTWKQINSKSWPIL